MQKLLGLLCCVTVFFVQAATVPFSSDIPALTAEHLHSEHWLTSEHQHQLLLTAEQIAI